MPTPSPGRYIPLLAGRTATEAAASQGHVWEGIHGQGEILDATETVQSVDSHGDRLRKQIWRYQDQAYEAARAGDLAGVLGWLHRARGLRGQYEQTDADEEFHWRRIAGTAMAVLAALQQSGLIHEHWLTGRPLVACTGREPPPLCDFEGELAEVTDELVGMCI